MHVMLETTSSAGVVTMEEPATSTQAGPMPAHASPLVQSLIERRFAGDEEYLRFLNGQTPRTGLVDFLFATGAEPHEPEQVFPRLRWGGLFVFASSERREVEAVSRQFPAAGF